MLDMAKVIPSHIRTVTLNIKSKSGKRIGGHIAYPMDLIRAHDHKNGDRIVIVYICKAGEKLDDANKEE